MDFEALSVAFVQWQCLPEILCKPETVRSEFKFLCDRTSSYPPSGLPIIKPLGRVVPINSEALEIVPQTSKFWSILSPHYPVQVVPSIGLRCTLPGVAVSEIELRIFIHSLGLVTTFSATIKSVAPIAGFSLADLLSEMEQGHSLRCDCHAMQGCSNVRTLFKRVADLLVPQILTVKPEPLHRDVRVFRPYCVLMPHSGNFPSLAGELETLPDAQLQLHAAIERVPASQGEVDSRDRYGVDIGRQWRTGVETGWVFSSMNGLATYIRNEFRTQAKPKRAAHTLECHFHNVRTVVGLYRLAYSFVAAGLLNATPIPEEHLHYGAEVVRTFRTEYPAWGIRWGIRRLKVHEKVNNLVEENGTGTEAGYKVFVSYAHEDEQWLTRFRTVLGPEIKKGNIVLKTDEDIKPGAPWDDRITGWLQSAKAAVLFVSPFFLNSDFISKTELPALLKASLDRGLKIYWVLVADALWQSSPLFKVQSADRPPSPWDKLAPAEQETKLCELAQAILRDIPA
jgi:TIR domain